MLAPEQGYVYVCGVGHVVPALMPNHPWISAAHVEYWVCEGSRAIKAPCCGSENSREQQFAHHVSYSECGVFASGAGQ